MSSRLRRAARRALRAGGAIAVLLATGAGAARPPALAPPSPETLAEARAIVAAMQASERGPYKWLRWYCDDGSVHPPSPYPCAERGGGHQHAEYSAARRRLRELGWSVGTILHLLTSTELLDPEHRNRRLRELPLERYLGDVADGWVLRRAQYYRGRVQVEDEEAAGTRLLRGLLAEPGFVADNFLLVREAVRTLPHAGAGDDRTRDIRRLAKELSDLVPSFERLRIKIHTAPAAGDAEAVRDWASQAAAPPSLEVSRRVAELTSGIDALYGARGRAERLRGARAALSRQRQDDLAQQLAGIDASTSAERVHRLSRLLAGARDRMASSGDPGLNLLLMDLSLELEGDLIAIAHDIAASSTASRRSRLLLAIDLLDASYGAGLLSARERQALQGPVRRLLEPGRPSPSAAEYLAASRGLERVGSWGLATVRYSFAEPLIAYASLEPAAARFPDDLLRGSPLLPLARVSGRLARDAEGLTGVAHLIFEQRVGGLAGLNPGAALGRLRIVDGRDLLRAGELGGDDIVVLPLTVSELPPVAGIISLAEGNILSHVQLLARNLGIPNATLAPSLRDALSEHDGRRVLLAVATDGSVVLADAERVPAEIAARLAPAGRQLGVRVDAPVPDLGVRRILPLAELNAGLSGRVVGPKAANLGELSRRFPGRVEPALALPFGLFAAHATAGDDPPKRRLDRAFARFRDGEIDLATRDQEIERVRQAVAALALQPEVRAELDRLLAELFGAEGRVAVFIRSDTNVEDLPEFTGAGLNETLANVIGGDAVAAGIARVWASPFRPRAVAWRSRALSRPEDVYPSVLVMKSVPADKSGVLVTRDLATGGVGITVAIAWGVGGAVDGDSAESIVLLPDGSQRLLAEAKAPYRRELAKEGGLVWRPAPHGAVLTSAELAQLRGFAAEVEERLEPAIGRDGRALPWDVELGFVNGRLTLFQVRPLVERGGAVADAIVAALTAATTTGSGAAPARAVDLERAPERSPAAPAATEAR